MVLLPSKAERKTRRHLLGRWGIAKTGQVSSQGVVEQWERWEGQIDAVVKPEPFRIRIHPSIVDPAPLIAALETAVRAHEHALRNGTPEQRSRTAHALAEAKQQLMRGI
jgi:hypothetical protein